MQKLESKTELKLLTEAKFDITVIPHDGIFGSAAAHTLEFEMFSCS